MKKNIHDVGKTLFETYERSNDKFNPYQILRDSTCFGLLHDATTQYVKEVNTVFIREVSSDGHVIKVPYCMHNVPGSLTGEVFCDELVEQISQIKTVHNNAFEIVPEKIRSRDFEYTPEVKWKICQIRLQNAATNMDFDKLQSEQMIVRDLLRKIFI